MEKAHDEKDTADLRDTISKATGKMTVMDNTLTVQERKAFIFIDCPGADKETVDWITLRMQRWLKEGGPLVFGGGTPDRPKMTIALGYMDDLSGIVVIPQKVLPEHPTFAFQDAQGQFSVYEKFYGTEYEYRLSAPSLQELTALYKTWKDEFLPSTQTA